LLAAEFYELGFRGERGGLNTTFGEILGQSFDPSMLSNGLGDYFEIERGYFKPYSGCRYTHAAIDAVLALQADRPVDNEEIDSVDVATYDIAAHLSDPAPKTPLAGRFSLPYVVAATLINGSAGPEIFTPAMLIEPSVLDLANKVNVTESVEYTSMTPARRPAQVILRFKDGTQLEKTVFGSKGDPDQPMTAEELETKFFQLCNPHIGSQRTQQAWNELGRLEQSPNIDDILQLLSMKSN
jgi:2-methylcitrate dehydratase PrpD